MAADHLLPNNLNTRIAPMPLAELLDAMNCLLGHMPLPYYDPYLHLHVAKWRRKVRLESRPRLQQTQTVAT